MIKKSHSIDNDREDVVYIIINRCMIIVVQIFSMMKTCPYIVSNLFLTLSIKWRVKLTKESLKNYRSQWTIVKHPSLLETSTPGRRVILFFISGDRITTTRGGYRLTFIFQRRVTQWVFSLAFFRGSFSVFLYPLFVIQYSHVDATVFSKLLFRSMEAS